MRRTTDFIWLVKLNAGLKKHFEDDNNLKMNQESARIKEYSFPHHLRIKR
jgi:hypothetical protein